MTDGAGWHIGRFISRIFGAAQGLFNEHCFSGATGWIYAKVSISINSLIPCVFSLLENKLSARAGALIYMYPRHDCLLIDASLN